MNQKFEPDFHALPLEGSVQNQIEAHGVDRHTAMDTVQNRYEKFKTTLDEKIVRQTTIANNTQIQLISHFSLLATLTLTVVGFLITQTAQPLTQAQRITVILILCCEVISLLLGALDYLQSIKFHNSWAKKYQEVDKEISRKLDTAEIQWLSDLGDIQRKHTAKAVRSTNKSITYAMIGACISGLFLLILLFVAYFFDLPVFR